MQLLMLSHLPSEDGGGRGGKGGVNVDLIGRGDEHGGRRRADPEPFSIIRVVHPPRTEHMKDLHSMQMNQQWRSYTCQSGCNQ